MDKFVIGDLCLAWDGGGYDLIKGKYFEQFRVEDSQLDTLVFRGRFEELEPYTRYKQLEENYSYETYDVNGEQLMIYHWAYRKLAFGIWPGRVQSDGVNEVLFDPALKMQPRMNMDWFMGLTGLHRALLQKEAPIFHASYIDYNGKAILFSAPSQTGKSTQADLWAKSAGTEIINGDRVLLRKRGDCWHAFGFPSCGSSNICINRTLPIGAIVILHQGSENEVSQMPLTDKIRSIMAGIEVYRWDLKEVEHSLQLAQQIATQVPVVNLTCRPDEDAVKVLRNFVDNSLHL